MPDDGPAGLFRPTATVSNVCNCIGLYVGKRAAAYAGIVNESCRPEEARRAVIRHSRKGSLFQKFVDHRLEQFRLLGMKPVTGAVDLLDG